MDTGIRRAADIALVNVTAESLVLPETKYQVTIEIPTKLYALMIKDLASAGENVTITVTANAVKFEADGERGRVENVFHKGHGAFALTHWNFDASSGVTVVEQTFALRFLVAFSKACPLSDTVG